MIRVGMARSTGKQPVQRSTGRQRAVTGKFPSLRRTLLVVDDEPEIARLIQRWFEKLGYRIIVAGDGAEALARVQEELPDLVLLDLHLPKVDGWEVCEKIKADPRTAGIPVVLMTAQQLTVGEAQAGLALGADEVLLKPFVREVLIHNVQRLLAGR